MKPGAEARTADQVSAQAVWISELALLKPRKSISATPQYFSAIQDDSDLQEVIMHMNTLREVGVTFAGGFPPYKVPGVVCVPLCNVCEWISGEIPAGID